MLASALWSTCSPTLSNFKRSVMMASQRDDENTACVGAHGVTGGNDGRRVRILDHGRSGQLQADGKMLAAVDRAADRRLFVEPDGPPPRVLCRGGGDDDSGRRLFS